MSSNVPEKDRGTKPPAKRKHEAPKSSNTDCHSPGKSIRRVCHINPTRNSIMQVLARIVSSTPKAINTIAQGNALVVTHKYIADLGLVVRGSMWSDSGHKL